MTDTAPTPPAIDRTRTTVDPDGPQAEIDPSYLRPDGRSRTVVDRTSSDSPVPAPLTSPVIPDPGLPPEDGSVRGMRYAVGELLGAGATSHVYAAHDRSFDRDVAVKFLSAELAGDGRRMARFIREARITARLEHPNIAPVYDLDTTPDGDLYLTMRQVSGMSLGEALRRDQGLTGDWNRIVTIVLKLCDALTYAHAHGVVHRDLKPDNVMLGYFGEVVLVDWGAARSEVEPELQQSRIVGTPAYMSPEQARGDRADALSDVYGVGATLFHVLVGRLPTDGRNDQDFWVRKRLGEIDQPSASERARIPKRLMAITLKAMASSRTQRYRDIAALADDLRQYQAGQAVSAYRDSAGERLLRWHRRHWRTLWSTVGALALALGSLALLYGERLKEIAHWGPPLVVEEFADTDWIKRWTTADGGHWDQRDGRMVSAGPQANFLFWRKRLHGAVAVEFEGELLPGSPPCDLSLTWTPTEPVPGKPIGLHSWWLQVGAHDNAHSIIHGSDAGGLLAEDPFHLEVGRRYHLRFEIDGDRLAILVDGKPLLSTRTNVPLSSGWIGIYTYYPGKAFDRVVLYNKGLAERIPPTTVGDAFVEQGLLEQAVDAYHRVEESQPGMASGQLAAYRRGLVLEQLGRRVEATSAWSGITDAELSTLAACRRIEWNAEANHHQSALEMFRRVAASAPPAARSRLPIVIHDCIRSASMVEEGPQVVEGWGEAVEQYLGDSLPARRSVAQALNQLDRPELVIERYSQLRWEYAAALLQLGRSDEVLARFLDNPFQPAAALLAQGRFAELEKTYGHMHFFIDPMLCASDRIPEAIEAQRKAGRFPWRELVHSGRYAEVLEPQEEGFIEERALSMYGVGRLDDAKRLALGSPPGVVVEPLLIRLGLPDQALARTIPVRSEVRRQIWAWMYFDALDRGDAARATQAREALGKLPRRMAQELAWLEPWLLLPLAEGPDDADIVDQTMKEVLDRGTTWQMQRPWHLAALVTGRIDEAAFLAQPCRRSAPGALAFAKGLRAERAGERSGAAAAFREYLAMPLHLRDWDVAGGLPAADRYAEWRLHALEKPE